MPDEPATMRSQAPREETIFIGPCDGMMFVPASEYQDYLKGFLQMSLWAAALLVPLTLAVILIYWGRST
jgi:hypothetical protein